MADGGTSAKDALPYAAEIAWVQTLFDTGEITEASNLIEQIPGKDLDPSQKPQYYFLMLGIGLYGRGDSEKVKLINNSLQIGFHPALRYRLALRTGDIPMAKKIRSQSDLPFDVTEDFGWSACLSSLWAGRRSAGMRLYQRRMFARNFGKFTPEGLVYKRYEGGEDCGRVFLEQGLGDFLLHMAIMNASASRDDHLIVGAPRIAPFVKSFLPNATFRSILDDLSDLKGLEFHASGDYLAPAFDPKLGFKPKPFLDERKKSTFPVFGIGWRGGSAQNRREERRIDLEQFLDMLPRGFHYLALQADITDEEAEIIKKSDRVQLPGYDIRRHTWALFHQISQLAGVISIDCANWHLAGLARVPIYAMMNKTVHWYWGPDQDVNGVYPGSTVCQKTEVTTRKLENWCKKMRREHKDLPAPAIRSSRNVDRPVFIVGAPRSGTSMVAGVFGQMGLWMGPTVAGNKNNQKGYFENGTIRETVIKPMLVKLGGDPLGIRDFFPVESIPPQPGLPGELVQLLQKQQYNGQMRWAYKEPKLTLLWPAFADAFPDADWIIVRRNIEDVVKSCQNTGFMAKHSKDAEFWRHFVGRYSDRLDLLAASHHRVHELNADLLSAGKFHQARQIAENIGLDWHGKKATEFIDPALFGRHG